MTDLTRLLAHEMSDRLRAETQMHLVPAEGSLPYRTFYEYIAARGFPVTQFIRHGPDEFTGRSSIIDDNGKPAVVEATYRRK